jgi:hypothetical protein
MKTAVTLFATLTLGMVVLVTPTLAQKGMGDRTGVARQAVTPEVVTLTGTLVEINTGPCEKTTGRSPIGTHVLLKTTDGKQLNIHLGPARAVADLVAKLTVGEELTVNAFRTEKMAENHYVAQSLVVDKTTIQLRDASLRPVWARGARGTSPATAVDGQHPGPGWRPGYGRGWARGSGWQGCPGCEYGWCPNCGYGWWPGCGYGWGPGYGRGHGWGRGPGYGWGGPPEFPR